MKEIKILYRKPVEAEYKEIKVFDNLDDYLKVYNDGKDRYETDTYYHTDIMYKPVIYQGMRMIVVDDFELIGH